MNLADKVRTATDEVRRTLERFSDALAFLCEGNVVVARWCFADAESWPEWCREIAQ